MTLEKFNYLTMLCEERNVTKAAQRLFITQPTLTVFLNKLERDLGFRLFDRSHNPVTLTYSGQIYMERIRALLLEENRLIEEIRDLNQPRDTIRIGIGQIHSEMMCPHLIFRLLKKWPDLNVTLREDQEMQIMECLRRDEIDVFLGHVEIDTVNFRFEPLFEETLVIAVPENLMPEELLRSALSNGLAHSTIDTPFVISPDVLANMPLIRPAKSQGAFLNLKQFLDQYHIHPTQTIQTANMITAAGMLQMGMGYMYLAPMLLETAHVEKPCRIYPCTLPKMIRSRKFYIGYKEDNPNVEQITEIKSIVRTLSRERQKSSVKLSPRDGSCGGKE